MWKKLIPKTIRGRITAVTASITLLITLFTTAVCFCVFQSFLKKNQIQSAQFSLQVVSSNISADMKDILYFSRWCCSNKVIGDYLEGFKGQSKLPTISKDKKKLRPLALSSYSRLNEEYYTTQGHEYMTRVLISSNNENNFLQMIPYADNSYSYAAQTVKNSGFFNQLYESKEFLWIGITPGLFNNGNNNQCIPIVRPISNEFNSEIIGWVYVEISDRLFTDYLAPYPLAADGALFLTIGPKQYEITSQGLKEVSSPYKKKEGRTSEKYKSQTGEAKALPVTMADGKRRILVEQPMEGLNGWYLSQILSEQQLIQQRYFYSLLIIGICLAIASLGTLLGFLLNRMITAPIKKLCIRMKAVSEGDFSRDEAIEWNHELGLIGKGVNSMSENIVTLMNKRVADEKQKKDLEYQILQNQINPHFLYNTLNSIKWMATIQNASGIADMTTALARLLKNVSKGTAPIISLREELDLVKDYFLIQQYRYGGSVTMEYSIESEDLYDCEIHRFTLQPIIENALFHGIEPKGTAGKITVSAKAVSAPGAKALSLCVTDNGVGMTADRIKQVLTEENEVKNKTEFFRHVGISNVNQRIQYDFGPEYGITIESQPDVYTAMTILRPYIKHISEKQELK